MANFRGFKIGELDEHGKPKIMSIKCQKCGKQFNNITHFNKHKTMHKRHPKA